jgi:hypothetical protein
MKFEAAAVMFIDRGQQAASIVASVAESFPGRNKASQPIHRMLPGPLIR